MRVLAVPRSMPTSLKNRSKNEAIERLEHSTAPQALAMQIVDYFTWRVIVDAGDGTRGGMHGNIVVSDLPDLQTAASPWHTDTNIGRSRNAVSLRERFLHQSHRRRTAGGGGHRGFRAPGAQTMCLWRHDVAERPRVRLQ